jgi:hypothetical protein
VTRAAGALVILVRTRRGSRRSVEFTVVDARLSPDTYKNSAGQCPDAEYHPSDHASEGRPAWHDSAFRARWWGDRDRGDAFADGVAGPAEPGEAGDEDAGAEGDDKGDAA